LPKVSMVLPVYNDQNDIGDAIQSLEEQTFEDREILVVDDGSTDSTVTRVSNLIEAGKLKDIRLVPIKHSGLTHVRNVGISEAKGEIVFFAESDCLYDREYVSKAVVALDAQPTAGAVCLTGAPAMVRSTVATECIKIENELQHKRLRQGKIRPFYAWVFRKDVLMKLGGFDEHLFQGEDKDIFKRLEAAGYPVAWVPGVHWWHKRGQTLGDMASKYVKRGESRILYVIKHRLGVDLVKTLTPFWTTVIGLLLVPFAPSLGAALIVVVLLVFLIRSSMVVIEAWDVVDKKRYFVAYPFYLVVRNFATCIGYTAGFVQLAFGGNRAK